MAAAQVGALTYEIITMNYHHRFRVRASLARVAEFHSHAASMPAILPPPIIVRVHHAPPILANGDEMDFTMWLGPLPVRWLARIETVSPTGFSDRQLRGPFAEWLHRHTLVAVDENTTEVRDEITLRLLPHLLWWPIGLGMRLGLPILFAFRAWKTKRILE
jgi:ligand-binding SRPBCC domain-containing protein